MVIPIIEPHTRAAGRSPCSRSALELHGLHRRASPSATSPSMSSSSAAAPIRGSPTCGRPRRCCKGGTVARGVRMLVVPGSQQVKREAEAEGLRSHLPRRRRGMARVGLLDVHRHERRHRRAPASTASAPATAISRAARARARARCWRAPLTAAATAVTRPRHRPARDAVMRHC